MARIRVREAGDVIEIERDQLLALVQTDSELSDIFMRAFILRRVELIERGYGDVVLLGSAHSPGTLRIKEFLEAYYAEGDTSVLAALAEPPIFLPERVTLDRLIEAFHDHRTQMVFLVDEYGGVEGLVTLRDVIDELFRTA